MAISLALLPELFIVLALISRFPEASIVPELVKLLMLVFRLPVLVSW